MKKSNKQQIARATRQAIDSYPGGLCFSTPGGRPILVNMQMNSLICELTGHTLMECNATWEEMRLGRVNGTPLPPTDLLNTANVLDGDNNLFFKFLDEKIWHFQRIELSLAGAVQITATDITKFYHMSAELYMNNQQLMKMHQRQRALLKNIVEINRGKELLNAKMRIHDELGECLLWVMQAQREETLAQDHSRIARTWLDTLHGMGPMTDSSATDAAEAELLEVAQLIGCKIHFSGPRPQGNIVRQLLNVAVREALLNAVCHAHADTLFVCSKEQLCNYQVRITDNGDKLVENIREGVGLTGLRRRLEQEGATMTILCGQGVTLILELPKECEQG